MESHVGNGAKVFRPLALERAREARARLKQCRLCAHECGADRTAGPAGYCRAGSEARIFQQRVDWAGERSLAPSLVLNLSGCNFRCAFCITGSRSWNAAAGEELSPGRIAADIEAYGSGLRSLTIEGGETTIHLAPALEIVSRVPRSIRLVWKTNAYASDEALALLEGTVDVVLADYKFGNDACAERLAQVPDYVAVVQRNLRWARRQGPLIVRHLLMPGHLDCCFRPVARWMAQEMPDVPLSLMRGYVPTWQATRHAELNRFAPEAEAAVAEWEATQLGLTLEPWTLASPSQAELTWQGTGWKPADGIRGSAAPGSPGERDEIWIDRQGRVCVGFASGALAEVLADFASRHSTQTFNRPEWCGAWDENSENGVSA